MDKKRTNGKKKKKPWHEPVLFLLNTKKTGSGYIEASYEDSRYTNPTASY